MLADPTSAIFLGWINAHPLEALLLMAWSLAWKGFALWRAAERGQKKWFIAILLLNSFGLVEIIYLLFIVRRYQVEVVRE